MGTHMPVEGLKNAAVHAGAPCGALHFILLFDTSGSMAHDGKIQALNNATLELIPYLQEFQQEHPSIKIMIRLLTFSTGACWRISRPTPLDELLWPRYAAAGLTDLGAALKLLADEFRKPEMENLLLPPVLILGTDGQPTDDWETELEHLKTLPAWKKSLRLALAIGDDVDFEVLDTFIGGDELPPPMQANNLETMAVYIRCFSMGALQMLSRSGSPSAVNSSANPGPDGTKMTPPPWGANNHKMEKIFSEV